MLLASFSVTILDKSVLQTHLANVSHDAVFWDELEEWALGGCVKISADDHSGYVVSAYCGADNNVQLCIWRCVKTDEHEFWENFELDYEMNKYY